MGICLFPWEETKVPQRFVDDLNANFQGIVAPSRSVEKALADSGVRIPIGAIGQPTRSAHLQCGRSEASTSAQAPLVPARLVLLPAQGADILLKAWQRAFRDGDPVRLVIKTFPNPHNTIEADVQVLRSKDARIAPIEIINRICRKRT